MLLGATTGMVEKEEICDRWTTDGAGAVPHPV